MYKRVADTGARRVEQVLQSLCDELQVGVCMYVCVSVYMCRFSDDNVIYKRPFLWLGGWDMC